MPKRRPTPLLNLCQRLRTLAHAGLLRCSFFRTGQRRKPTFRIEFSGRHRRRLFHASRVSGLRH